MDPKIIIIIVLVIVAIFAFASVAFATSSSGGAGDSLFGKGASMRGARPGCNGTSMPWQNGAEMPCMRGSRNATNTSMNNETMRPCPPPRGASEFNQSQLDEFETAVEGNDFASAKRLNGKYGLGGPIFERLNESTFKTYSEMFSLQGQLKAVMERLDAELGGNSGSAPTPLQEGGMGWRMGVRKPPVDCGRGTGNGMRGRMDE